MLGALLPRHRQAAGDGRDRRPHQVARPRGRRRAAGDRAARSPAACTRSTATRCAQQVLGLVAWHMLPGAGGSRRSRCRRRVSPPGAKVDMVLLARARRGRLQRPRRHFDCSSAMVPGARPGARRRARPARAAAARPTPARPRRGARARDGRDPARRLRAATRWHRDDPGRGPRRGARHPVWQTREPALPTRRATCHDDRRRVRAGRSPAPWVRNARLLFAGLFLSVRHHWRR